MSTRDDGGPAFPESGLAGSRDGMSLRDYFAAQAMAAQMANSSTMQAIGRNGQAERIVAGIAYLFADAMLKERAK